MRPNTKLGVAEPLGSLVRLQPLARPVEGALLDFRNNVLRARLARDEERGRSGYDCDRISPADLHELVAFWTRFCPNRPCKGATPGLETRAQSILYHPGAGICSELAGQGAGLARVVAGLPKGIPVNTEFTSP
jgi:hypothetical protein